MPSKEKTKRKKVRNVQQYRYANGVSKWRCHWTDGGVRKWGPLRETKAQAYLDYVMHASRPTLEEWVSHCAVAMEGRYSEACVRQTGTLLKRLGIYADKRVDEIDAGTIQRMVDLWTIEHGPNAARGMWAALRRCLREARTVGLIVDIQSPRLPKAEERRAMLTDAQIRDLIRCDDYGMASVAVLTGMRMCELRNLRWEDIDWEHKLIRIRRSKHAKTDSHIPLTPKVEEILSGIERSPGLVWWGADPHKPIYPNAIHVRWKALKAKAGLPDELRFHDLRAVYATRLVIMGADPRTAQALLRHSKVETTLSYYVRFVPKQADEVARKIAESLS